MEHSENKRGDTHMHTSSHHESEPGPTSRGFTIQFSSIYRKLTEIPEHSRAYNASQSVLKMSTVLDETVNNKKQLLCLSYFSNAETKPLSL